MGPKLIPLFVYNGLHTLLLYTQYTHQKNVTKQMLLPQHFHCVSHILFYFLLSKILKEDKSIQYDINTNNKFFEGSNKRQQMLIANPKLNSRRGEIYRQETKLSKINQQSN